MLTGAKYAQIVQLFKAKGNSKMWKMWKSKMCNVAENMQNCAKYAKNCKMFEIVQNMTKC